MADNPGMIGEGYADLRDLPLGETWHTEAFSFQIATENQEETDRYWNAIVGNGGMGPLGPFTRHPERGIDPMIRPGSATK